MRDAKSDALLMEPRDPRFTLVPDRDQGVFLDFQDREVRDREITIEQMMQGRRDV